MFPAYSTKDATAPGVGAASKGAPTAGNNQQAVLQMFRQLQKQIPGFENIPSPSALVEQQRQQHDKEVFKGVSRSNVFAQSINRGGVEQGLKTDEQVQVANMAVFGGNRVDQSQKESGADLVSGAFRSMMPPSNAAQTQKKQEKSGQANSASTNWQANLLDYGKEENNPDKDKKSKVPPTPEQIQQNYQAFAGYPQYPGYFPYPGYAQYPGYPYPGYQYPGYPPFPSNAGYPALPSNTNPQEVAYPNPQHNYPQYGYMAYDQNGQPIIPPPQADLHKQDPSSSSQYNPNAPKRDGQRSASPRRERERSPNRDRRRSPNRERRRSPTRDRQRSPMRDRQRSPIRDRQRERLPKDRQTFTRRDRSRSRSPRRDRSRTPTRDRPRSPRSMLKQGYSDQGKSYDKQNRTMKFDHGNQAKIKSEYDSLMTNESNRMGSNQGSNRGGGSRGAGGRVAGQGAGKGANDRGGRGAEGRGRGGKGGGGRGDGGRGGRGGGGGKRWGGNRNDRKEEEEEFSNPWLKSFEQLQAEYEEELRQEQGLSEQNEKSENNDDIIYVGSDEPKQWPWQQTDYKTDRLRDDRQKDNRSGNLRDNDRRDRNEVSKRNNEPPRDNRDRSDRNTNDRRGNDHSKSKDDKYSRSDYPDSRRNNEPPRDRYRNDSNTNDRVGNYSSRGTDNKNARSDSSGTWQDQYEQLKEKAASREGSQSEKKQPRWTRDANGKLQYFPLPPPKQLSSSSDYSKMPPPNARPTKQKAKETVKDNMDVQDMVIEEDQQDFVANLTKGKHTPVQKEKPKRHEIQLKYSSKFVKSQNEETNDYYKSERDKIAEAMASASSSSFSKDQSSTLEDPRKPLIGAQISNPISKFMKTVGKSKGGVKIVARKYHLPGNCIGLLPPKMAQEVWEILKKPTKLRDDTLTDVQRWLSLGIIPVIQLIDKFGTGPREAKEVCRMTSDALTVLGYVTWNMSIKRRLLIRSSINKKYAPLCRTLNDISQFLFGDNLAKDLADIKFGSYKFQNSNEEDNDDRLSPNFKQTIFIGLALFGEDVDADLASMINMACANDGNVDDLKEKYKIPTNCEFLLPSKINPEMWSLLSFSGLELDYKLQNVQLSVAEGIVPLMKLLWAVQEGKYDPGEALAILTDSLALLGNAVYQLNTVRMEAMLKTLPEQVHGYAHWNWLGAEQISGDNLEKELANCDDEKSKRRAGLIRGVLDSQKNQA